MRHLKQGRPLVGRPHYQFSSAVEMSEVKRIALFWMGRGITSTTTPMCTVPNRFSLAQMYERYRNNESTNSILRLARSDEAGLSQQDLWLKRYSRPIPIWFQGVWDTVGALGVPMRWVPNISSDDFAFLGTDLRINDTHAYHVLALLMSIEKRLPRRFGKSVP